MRDTGIITDTLHRQMLEHFLQNTGPGVLAHSGTTKCPLGFDVDVAATIAVRVVKRSGFVRGVASRLPALVLRGLPSE